jgi:hypothetical protein
MTNVHQKLTGFLVVRVVEVQVKVVVRPPQVQVLPVRDIQVIRVTTIGVLEAVELQALVDG